MAWLQHNTRACFSAREGIHCWWMIHTVSDLLHEKASRGLPRGCSLGNCPFPSENSYKEVFVPPWPWLVPYLENSRSATEKGIQRREYRARLIPHLDRTTTEKGIAARIIGAQSRACWDSF
eukprot:1155740-Pelagomonas_calceolata.AAC.7